MNSKILQNIQIEVDASYLYKVLAGNEDDANVAHVFNEMSEIEKSHAILASFVLFAIGAIIPVIPFFFVGGFWGIFFSAASSAIGLFVKGSIITLFTGKSIWFSGFRQVVFGLCAAAITFGIGKLIGVSVAG